MSRRVDVHELLKQEAFATNAKSCLTHFEKNRPCPSDVYGVSDQYMVLDSFEKVRESRPDRGVFVFNFMVQGVTRDQNIGVKERLDTVIGIHVCDFTVPRLPFDEFDPAATQLADPSLPAGFLSANGGLPTVGDAVTNPQSQLPFNGRVILYLKEIGLQSYSDADDRRHHFEFEAEMAGPSAVGVLGDRFLLKTVSDCKHYIFTDPIKDIHGLTLCFYNPSRELRFPPDVLYNVAVAADAAGLLTFAYTDPTNLINLEVGDRVFVKGFSSTSPTLNKYVNRDQGHLVGANGYVVTPPATAAAGTAVGWRLNPDVDVTTLAPPFPANAPIASTTTVDVRIAKNRLRIPMRFRRVVDRVTNYIAP